MSIVQSDTDHGLANLTPEFKKTSELYGSVGNAKASGLVVSDIKRGLIASDEVKKS